MKRFLKHQTDSTAGSPTIPEKLGGIEHLDVTDCVETYGDLVWTVATKYTASSEEVEAVTRQIFRDIWRFSEHHGLTRLDKTDLVIILARRLNKRLQ